MRRAAAVALATLLAACAIVENIDPNGAPVGRVILWPPGTDLRQIDGVLHVVVGSVAATDGDEIQMSGGEYKQEDQAWVEHLVGDIRNCRSDLYWLASTLEIQ